MSNKKELDKVFSGYDNALRIEDEIKDVLKQFDTKEEKVSEVLFNVYPDEMKAIVKHFAGNGQFIQGFSLCTNCINPRDCKTVGKCLVAVGCSPKGID